MNWRHTHVWEINHQLVVADTVEEAISIYRIYSERGILSEPITIQQIGNSDAIGKDYSAIMGYDERMVMPPEPSVYPMEKPIDVFDIKPAPSSADVNWNTNDTQSTSKLNWMHKESTSIPPKEDLYYGN